MSFEPIVYIVTLKQLDVFVLFFYFASFVLRLLFGILGAFLGGAGIVRGGMRVVIGGWIALGKC